MPDLKPVRFFDLYGGVERYGLSIVSRRPGFYMPPMGPEEFRHIVTESDREIAAELGISLGDDLGPPKP